MHGESLHQLKRKVKGGKIKMVELEKLLGEIERIGAGPKLQEAKKCYARMDVSFSDKKPAEYEALGLALAKASARELESLIPDILEVILYGEQKEIERLLGSAIYQKLGHDIGVSHVEPDQHEKEEHGLGILRIWYGCPSGLNGYHFDSGGKGLLLQVSGPRELMRGIYSSIDGIPGVSMPSLEEGVYAPPKLVRGPHHSSSGGVWKIDGEGDAIPVFSVPAAFCRGGAREEGKIVYHRLRIVGPW